MPISAFRLLIPTRDAKASAWIVAIVFTAVGFILGAVVPTLLIPEEPPNALRVEGVVERLVAADGQGSSFPVFEYRLPDGTAQTYTSNISSNPPMYRVGDKAVLIIDPTQHDRVYIENDIALQFALVFIRILAGVFFVIGTAVLLMLVRGVDVMIINRIGGLMGALSFGIPATLALPALWYGYQSRPNMFFRADDVFGQDELFIGALFSILGVITTVATIALYQYQVHTGRAGWSWSWSSGDTKKDEQPPVS